MSFSKARLLALAAILLAGCAAEPPASAPVDGAGPSAAALPNLSDPAANKVYFRGLVEAERDYVSYPEAERKQGTAGYVMVTAVINRAGEVWQTQLLRASGNPAFDAEALNVWPKIMAAGQRFPWDDPVHPHVHSVGFELPVFFCNWPCAPLLQYEKAKKASADAWRMAVAASKKGSSEEVLQRATESIDALPNASGMLAQAWAHRRLGRYDEAIADDTWVLSFFPECPDAYLDRARAYYATHRYRETVSDLSAAVQLLPDLAAAYRIRAQAYAHQDQRDLAAADFAKVIELLPNSQAALYDRAWQYHLWGKDQEAFQDIDRALALDPRSVGTYITRARIREARGERDLALADYRRASELDPGSQSAQAGVLRLGAQP